MARPMPRELEVIRTAKITPHMLRITLGGANMATIPQDQESAYIKLVFPQGDGVRPLLRTYTIRHQRQTEIDVDFVVHSQTGPASAWAINARAGNRIMVGGPGPKKLINHHADWYLLAGDMTALPAISTNLTQLPTDASGYVVIEVASEADVQDLEHPENMQLHWLINPTPDPTGTTLMRKVKALPWMVGQPSVWAACEFNSMRTLRQYFKQDCDVPRSHLYISSYWKIGQTEDQHKVAKRQDSEQQAA